MSNLLVGERFVAAYPKLIKALDGDVTSALVLQAINYRSNIIKPNEDGEIWVDLRIQEIADEIGISVPATQRALQRLRDKWLIVETQAPGYNNKKLWAINEDGLDELEKNSEANTVRERITNNAPANNYKFDSEKSSISKEVNKNIKNFSAECHSACELLVELIVANGSKEPKITKTWLSDMDKLNRLDGRSWEQIEAAIRWCQNDSFWKSNIMSPSSLREKYDQLRLKAQSQQKSSNLSGWARVIAKFENDAKELEQ